MTSTNDGKDVKSNLSSGPRGKTYYIELYKSLESRLNEECGLKTRTQYLGEAWRRVHNLCQHSAPTTHSHLLGWLQRHTAKTVLQTEWQSPKSKDEHINLEEAIDDLISTIKAAVSNRNGTSPPWENQLLQRGEWFKKILENPWGHSVLRVLLDPQGERPSDSEVLEWLKEERGVMFVTRLRQLSSSKCDDLALLLATAVMDRVRASTEDVPDAIQTEEAKDNIKSEDGAPSFADILRAEAGFTADVLEFVTDLEFVLLHKRGKHPQCIALAKKTPLRIGYQLVERLRSRLETSPREKKLWKNAKDVATLIAQVVIARCMVVPVCVGVARSALYCCARSLVRLVAASRLPEAAAALAAPATTARHLHTLASAVHAQSTDDMKPFVCELYVRAITAGMNELEKLKLKTEKESEARSMEQTLSTWFTQLGTLLSASARIQCECTLTAFSVHASPTMYEKIKAAPELPPVAIDIEPKEATISEFGSWANDSRSQTNFVKTSETLNLKQTQQKTNVLSTAIFTEGEALGLGAELCQDLAVCLSGPRVKTLSWDMNRLILLENCRTYMERTSGGTRALTTELKYLNLDPSVYQHLPEEEDNENDLYYGIEKGYEHLVEFPEPEEIWQDAEDFERTDTAYSSCSDSGSIILKRKKKHKKRPLFSDEECDPLSFDTDVRTEKKKERPHSKERSKDRSKETKKKEKNPVDPEKQKEKLLNKEKKKREKKERKKREKEAAAYVEPKPGSLSCLLGMKVMRIQPTDLQAPANVKHSANISDYEVQIKSPHSDNDSSVVFDGLYSMDEIKSPEIGDPLAVNSPLSLPTTSNSQESIKKTPLMYGIAKLDKSKSQSSTNIPIKDQKLTGPANVKSMADILRLGIARPQSYGTMNEQVKRSITKLLQFRRQGIKSQSAQTNKPSSSVEQKQATAIRKPDFPLQTMISPKVVNVPEIPKAYINKYQVKGLTIHREVATPVIQHTATITQPPCAVSDTTKPVVSPGAVSETKKPAVSNSAVSTPSYTNFKDILKVPSYHQNINLNQVVQEKPINMSTYRNPAYSAQSPRLDNSRQSTTLPDGKNLHDLLRELQDSISAGTGSKVPDTKQVPISNVKKEIKPMSRVPPFIPSTDTKPDSTTTLQCAKQVVQQKKVENAPNTFSRLSYMHKKKHSDVKPKPVRDSMANRKDPVIKQDLEDLNRQIDDFKNVKRKYLHSMVGTVITRVENCSHSKNPSESTSERQPVTKDHTITNILNTTPKAVPQRPVSRNDVPIRGSQPSDYVTVQRVTQQSPVKTSYLSEKDQNDLLLLLQQQSRINAAGSVSRTSLLTTENKSHTFNKSDDDNSLNKCIPYRNMSKSSPNTYSKNVVCANDELLEAHKAKISMLPNLIISNTKQNESHTNSMETKSESAIRNPINYPKTVLKSTEEKNKKSVAEANKMFAGEINKMAAVEKNKRIRKNILKNPSSEPMEDWEIVMNAIRAQKTPSRALPVQISSSSSMSENNLRNQRIVKPNHQTDTGKVTKTITDIMNQYNITKTSKSQSTAVSKGNTKDLTKLSHLNTQKKTTDCIKTQTKMDAHTRLPSDIQKKQLTCETLKDKDPFISGIENSDYDLLEELMDDDLRQEIGELSSDEDTYRGNTQLHLKGNKTTTGSKNSNIVCKSASTQKDKPNVNNSKCTKTIQTPLVKCNYSSKPSMETSIKEPAVDSKIKSSSTKSGNNMVKTTPKAGSNMQTNIAPPTTCSSQPDKTIDKNICIINKDNIVSNTPVSDSRNVYIATVPPQPPVAANVLVIGTDVFYDPFISMQSQMHPELRNINQTQQYLPTNRSDITLFHATPFTAPVVNSLIIGNTITVPLETPIAVACDNVQSGTGSVSQPYITMPPMTAHVTSFEGVSEQNNEICIDTKNKVDSDQVQRDTRHPTEYKTFDINLKISERKVLSEVQENQKLAEKCDVKIIRTQKLPSDDIGKNCLKGLENEKSESKCENPQIPVHEKEEIKIEAARAEDLERLKTKRLAIIQRVINHRSDLPPIPLTYSQLSSKTQMFVKLATDDGKKDNTKGTENYKENKSSLPCRRILLRSSNKDIPKISANVNDRNPIGRKTKVRLKVDNGEPTDVVVEKSDDIKLKKKRKKLALLVKPVSKVAKKPRAKVKTSSNENKASCLTQVSAKGIGIEDVNVISSNEPHFKLLDVEGALIGSKVPNLKVMTVTDPVASYAELNTDDKLIKDKTIDEEKRNEDYIKFIDNDRHKNVALHNQPPNALHQNVKINENELFSDKTKQNPVHRQPQEQINDKIPNKNTVGKRKSNRISIPSQLGMTTPSNASQPMNSFEKNEHKTVDIDSGMRKEKHIVGKRKSNRISMLTSFKATNTIETNNQLSNSFETTIIPQETKDRNFDEVNIVGTEKLEQSAQKEKAEMGILNVTQILVGEGMANHKNIKQSCIAGKGTKITAQSPKPVVSVTNKQFSLNDKTKTAMTNVTQISGSENVANNKNFQYTGVPNIGLKRTKQSSKLVETGLHKQSLLIEEAKTTVPNLRQISSGGNVAHHKNIKQACFSDIGMTEQASKSAETVSNKQMPFDVKVKTAMPNAIIISDSGSKAHLKTIKQTRDSDIGKKITDQSSKPVEMVSNIQTSVSDKVKTRMSNVTQLPGNENVAFQNLKQTCILDKGTKITEKLSKPVEEMNDEQFALHEKTTKMPNVTQISDRANVVQHKTINQAILHKGMEIPQQLSKPEKTVKKKQPRLNQKNKTGIPNATPISDNGNVLHNKNSKQPCIPDKRTKIIEQISKPDESVKNKVVTSIKSFQDVYEHSSILNDTLDFVQADSDITTTADKNCGTEVRKDCKLNNTRKRAISDAKITQGGQSLQTMPNLINELKSKSATETNNFALRSNLNQMDKIKKETKPIACDSRIITKLNEQNHSSNNSKMESSSIPQSYKNSISFEELPCNQSDPNMKRMRIKLSSGKVFTATVYGKMHTSFDSLFEDPAIKSILMSDVKEHKKYTLNIKQITTTSSNPNNPQQTRIQEIQVQSKNITPKKVETIDLLSDEEEDEVCNTFRTEFGQYKISLKDKDVIEKHQKKFDHKCSVQISRLPIPVQLIQETQESDQSPVNFPVTKSDKLEQTIVLPDIFQSQDRETHLEKQITPEIIEIDDSSNDSIDLLKSCPDLPIELISDIPKVNDTNDCLKLASNEVSEKSHTVNDNNKERTRIQEKVNDTTNLNHDLNISIPEISPVQGAVNEINDGYNILTKSLNCFVQLTKCDDLVHKFKVIEAMNRKYFVDLVRCDDIVCHTRQLETETDLTTDISDINLSTSDLSRYPSLSILNDFASDNELKSESTRIMVMTEDYDRSSPVMEVFEIIASLQKYSDIAIKGKRGSSEMIRCKCEWLFTKKHIREVLDVKHRKTRRFSVPGENKHVLSEVVYKDQNDKTFLVPSLMSLMTTYFQKHVKTFRVPSLMTLMTVYFQNSSILSHLGTVSKDYRNIGNKTRITRNLKRKLTEHRNDTMVKKVYKNTEMVPVTTTKSQQNYESPINVETKNVSSADTIISSDCTNCDECNGKEKETMEWKYFKNVDISTVKDTKSADVNITDKLTATKLVDVEAPIDIFELVKDVKDDNKDEMKRMQSIDIIINESNETVPDIIEYVSNEEVLMTVEKNMNNDDKDAKIGMKNVNIIIDQNYKFSNDINQSVNHEVTKQDDEEEVKVIERIDALNRQSINCDIDKSVKIESELNKMAENLNGHKDGNKDTDKEIEGTETNKKPTNLNSDSATSFNIILPNYTDEGIESINTFIEHMDSMGENTDMTKEPIESGKHLKGDEGVDSVNIVVTSNYSKKYDDENSENNEPTIELSINVHESVNNEVVATQPHFKDDNDVKETENMNVVIANNNCMNSNEPRNESPNYLKYDNTDVQKEIEGNEEIVNYDGYHTMRTELPEEFNKQIEKTYLIDDIKSGNEGLGNINAVINQTNVSIDIDNSVINTLTKEMSEEHKEEKSTTKKIDSTYTERDQQNRPEIIVVDKPENIGLIEKSIEGQNDGEVNGTNNGIEIMDVDVDLIQNTKCDSDNIYHQEHGSLHFIHQTNNVSIDIDNSVINKLPYELLEGSYEDKNTMKNIESTVICENNRSNKIDNEKSATDGLLQKSVKGQNDCKNSDANEVVEIINVYQIQNANNDTDNIHYIQEPDSFNLNHTNNVDSDVDKFAIDKVSEELSEDSNGDKNTKEIGTVTCPSNIPTQADGEKSVNVGVLEKSTEGQNDRENNNVNKKIEIVDVDKIQNVVDRADNNYYIQGTDICIGNEPKLPNSTLGIEKKDLTVYVNVIIDEVDKDEQDKLYNEQLNNDTNSADNCSLRELEYDRMEVNIIKNKTEIAGELNSKVHVTEIIQNIEAEEKIDTIVSGDSSESGDKILIYPQIADVNAVRTDLLAAENTEYIQGIRENDIKNDEETNGQICLKHSTVIDDTNTFENIISNSILDCQKDGQHNKANQSDNTNGEKSENSAASENVIKNVALLYHGDTDVILKGIEYDDPVVGMCYVFPIAESVSVSSGSNVRVLNADMQDSTEEIIQIIEEIDDVIAVDANEDVCEDTLEVIVPKITYSRLRHKQFETDLRRIKGKKNLKRKMDAIDPKCSAKKYRKGKNIDYPKITAAAMSDSAYSKEYKRVFDYCNSLKFSYSQPFHIDFIDVEDIVKDWPIKGECPEMDVEVRDSCELFIDNEDKPKLEFNTLKLTLAEEISIKYNENVENSIDISETNFNMGFGEGSGRVIQNLEDVDYISKVSAATLSDVKQPQPFLLSEDYDDCEDNVGNMNAKHDEIEKARRYVTYIQLRDKVRSFFKQTAIALKHEWIMQNKKLDPTNFPFDRYIRDFLEPCPVETIVQVVQVGQLPVSAAAQNPVTCDPRVTQVSDASPSQCSVENSPHDGSPSAIKTEYTELTTADLTLPLVQDYGQHTQTLPVESHEPQKILMTDENIPIETEIKSVVKIELMEELPEEKEESLESQDINEPQTLADKHMNNVEYSYDTNNTSSTLNESNLRMMYISPEKQAIPEKNSQQAVTENFSQQTVAENYPQQKQQNGSAEKTDQIAHAMNAAGITTASETLANTRAQALVNILSQKMRQGGVPGNTQTTTSSYSKTTSINAMALQQALAQILPPPLNQTNVTENNQQNSNTQVTPQVLHIVQGKNASGSQITLVDNSQQSVISGPNTPVLHIVQNKTGTTGATTNGSSVGQANSFSGLSLVDAGLQQGGNQLLHIVNTGGQKNNNAGQLLKRVNLLTNLANVQGSSDQKMVQFVCKSADGKAIQLNAPHQRSMVLRLQPIESPNIQPATPKPVESQELNQSSTAGTTLANKDNATQQEIKSRSVYEENYAKFIQSSNKPATVPVDAVKATSLPKFNQAFGKPVFQEGNQKPNEIAVNNMSSVNTGTTAESTECQANDNTMNIDHIGQISSPPLLLRKSPQTSQSQSNLVQQIKQTIAPMNIQTMHGGVIYTRQIPVNIGGGQTINLITVPSTELIDDSGQKQQSVNQGEMEPSIIKIVPQSQTAPNSDISTDDNASTHIGVSNENGPTPQPQPVLTQMRIKLPMLSKTPQMVSGARVVRPSFFQIQRNVIGGANQPVYQQLVLTAAPPLGQQTIRLPQAQANRQIKVQSENQSAESQMSSSTLEQLREFDMVLEQVKERSTVQPNTNTNTFSKLHTPSNDTTDNTSSTSVAPVEPTQVLYSIGNNQSLNVAYVNRKATVTTPTTSTYVRSPDSSGIADSPTSSTHVQIPHAVTTESSASETPPQPKAAKVGSKSKSRPKSSSHLSNSMKLNSVPPKTSTQKPLEDEQTTQRILYILAEYKEQVENSPDKDKPAPRRRSNPPSNPSGSSKRKKSSSGSRRPGHRDMSPVHGDDTCRTMGSEDSSCGTSQGDCNESCLDSHSPQDSPRKIVRKLTFEQETPIVQPRPQPQRNVIVADGQTITVARGTAGKPTTAVLMPANYILPVSMVKGGQQIAIVTNRGPKLLTVGGGEGGATNALLLQRLIGPAGLKPVLARPGVRHVRLPTAALHNLQAFNLATATTIQPPDSTASPAPAPTPPELVETRATSSPWTDRESQDVKPERGSSPEGSEPWNLQSSTDPHEYTYEETVRAENMDRTVLDPIPDRYSPDMEAQRIFDKMFDVDSKKSYIVDSHDDSPRCAYDIDASDCDDKAYHQVVHKKDGTSQRQHRLAHVSAAALRHKYAILEHELRLQKSLSEECEDLGVDSPSASELFPEAELLFAASPAHDHTTQDQVHHQSHTPQPTILNQSCIPQPDMDDQIATDQLIQRHVPDERGDLNLGLEDVGIVTVSEDGLQATIQLDHEEFAKSHPNTTFHSEPTDEGEVQPFTITGLKGRHITSTIFHSNRAPATVLMTAPQTTVISQATAEASGGIKYINTDIDNMIHSLPSAHGNNINLSSVLVKDDGLTRFDNILNDSREIHLTNTASAIVHATGNATQVIRRVCYDDKRDTSFLMDEPDALIAGDDAKMIGEDSSRDATLESMTGDVDDDRSSPEPHTELFWESNSASERSESRRPLDFSSDSDKCCKSPSYDETNSTDSSGVGTHMRLDSVIKEARGIERSGSADGSSADDTHPPLRTYPPKRMYHPLEGDIERSLSGKTRAGERSPDLEVRRRASGRGVVKRGCHCCNGSPAPPRPKKSRQRKPTLDFSTH